MRANSSGILAFLVGALAWSSLAAVSGPTRQQFPIPGHGSLSFDVPAEWRASSVPLAKPPSLTLSIRPATGDAFVLKMTTVWMDPAAGKKPTRDLMQEGVRGAAKDALAQAEEKNAPLVEIKGKDTSGYYFSVTDKHSSNSGGDYKYMSQGMAGTGPAMTVFTLLSRSPAPVERERALRVVASATWSDATPADTATAESSVQIEESAQGLRVSVPGSRVVMILPKGGLKKVPDLDRPGYFYFTDEARSLIVSGWFEPAERFPGMKKFWEDETRNASRSGAPEVQEVSFTKVGDWDAILYDLGIPDITNSHVRAQWVSNGTWIDVHLSTTGKRPRAESRASLVEVLKTLRVEQKR